MESLQAEVAPFGIATTIVNPGFFRSVIRSAPETIRSKLARAIFRLPRVSAVPCSTAMCAARGHERSEMDQTR
jgi:NAD(P)-dependent dehydrogenase (short-subunit alcohol dehydrogenase family)